MYFVYGMEILFSVTKWIELFNWTGLEATFYESFDFPCSLVFMEGSQVLTSNLFVEGKVMLNIVYMRLKQ